MARFHLDSISGNAGRRTPPASLPRSGSGREARRFGRWSGLGIAALTLLVTGLLWRSGQAYQGSPERTAERFLRASEAADVRALRELFTARYRELVSEQASGALLRALQSRVPRRCRVQMSGYPNMEGVVSERDRYFVRVEATDAKDASIQHKSFVILLRQERDGRWAVDPGVTYHSMFDSLYGLEGDEYLEHALREHTGSSAFDLLRDS